MRELMGVLNGRHPGHFGV